MGPERRGSKKSSWPSSAAAGESRYSLVVSTGKSGNGESVLMTTHSCFEKLTLSVSGVLLSCSFAVAAPPVHPDETARVTVPNTRPNHHSVDFRIVHVRVRLD